MAVAAVNRMARRILAPFDRLTDRIRASMSSDDFEPIPADDPALFTGRPLYRRIFRLFAVGLLLPAVCLGLLSSLLTNRMLASRLTGVAALHAAALQGALDDSLAISESILKMISGKPDFAEAAALSIDSLESGDYRERALELNSYINRYPLGMFNVAYLALQDVEGPRQIPVPLPGRESAESQLSRFSLLDQPDALAQVRALEGTPACCCAPICTSSPPWRPCKSCTTRRARWRATCKWCITRAISRRSAPGRRSASWCSGEATASWCTTAGPTALPKSWRRTPCGPGKACRCMSAGGGTSSTPAPWNHHRLDAGGLSAAPTT